MPPRVYCTSNKAIDSHGETEVGAESNDVEEEGIGDVGGIAIAQHEDAEH